LNDRKGYNKIKTIFDLLASQPKEKNFTQTVIGFTRNPILIKQSERNALAKNRNIDFHEVGPNDEKRTKEILDGIINRSLSLGHLVKISILGYDKKTVIMRKYADDKFDGNYLPTLGVDITTKSTNFHGLQVKLILMDTANQDFFGKLRPNYFRGASAGVIFYDISGGDSFNQIENWLIEFQTQVTDVPIALIGVRKGLESKSQLSVNEFALSHQMYHLLIQENEVKFLDQAFEKLVKQVFQRRSP